MLLNLYGHSQSGNLKFFYLTVIVKHDMSIISVKNQ